MIEKGTSLEKYKASLMREELMDSSKEFDPDLIVRLLKKSLLVSK
ncbi:hypothetical protein [Streptococcus lactarius]